MRRRDARTARSIAWRCRCRRRFRATSSGRSRCCRRRRSSCRRRRRVITSDWSPDDDADDESDDDEPSCSYVPIDPCQPVIAALRVALGEHIAAGVHRPGDGPFRAATAAAARSVRAEAVPLERSPPPFCRHWRRPHRNSAQRSDRVTWRARLRELEQRHKSILCRLLDARLALDSRSVSRTHACRRRTMTWWKTRRPISPTRRRCFSAGRTAVHHRPVRAGPGRAGRRREPVDRRREGAAARRPRRLSRPT